MLDGLAKGDDFLAGGTAEIYQHKGLLGVDCCTSETASTPAALVNHPCGGNLLVLLVNVVVGHAGILCGQRFVLGTADNGVHEETAGIASHLGVGQLLAPYVDDDIT